MPLRSSHVYVIGEFELDLGEKVLLRDGMPVPLTPKVFDTLVVLVENAGHLVEKDVLMERIWGDRCVEESNLSFNIKMLRKALGDSAVSPQFIETLPRRGYRFIADVRESSTNFTSENGSSSLPPAPAGKPTVSRRLRRFYRGLAAALILIVMVSGLWYAGSNRAGTVRVLSQPFALEKISADGNGIHAVVSPDGQNVVYTNGVEGKQSVWLRQLETSSNLQILAPSEYFYYGLALSPDGRVLYFNRRPKEVERQGDIYRVSIFGGVPVKVVSEAQGNISISPDGEKIAFVRCYYSSDEYCSLWVADAADGRNERKLLSRPRPLRIGDHEFSPDGTSIAFAVGQSENQAGEFGLSEVDIASGEQREVTGHKFFNIKSIAWLPNDSGLLVTASRMPDKTFHIWRISKAGGDAERLTSDGESYSALSLDKAASMLISTRVRQNYHLRIYGAQNPADGRSLVDATSVTFAPNGRIIFSSARTGNHEIWSINPDGSDQRQLTNNAAEDRTSAVSPDGGVIFFESNRSGEAQVWRMNSDGSNQLQITRTEGGFPIFVSPDGKWLYYSSALKKTLRRVSTGGGDEEVVLNRRSGSFAISPDGTRVALTEKRGDTVDLLILSLADKSTVSSFPLPAETNPWVDLAWTNDGKNVALITRNSEMQKNTAWLQSIVGGPVQHFADLGDEQISDMSGFAMSPDGNSFAVAIGRWEHDAVLLRGLN